MKHDNEIVDSRLVMRIICGLLVLGGIWAISRALVRLLTERPIDWVSAVLPIVSLYGLYVFGRYALTGNLNFMRKRRDEA